MEDLKGNGIDLASFEAKELFNIIKGRTLWVIGDSQAEKWYATLECFLSEFLEEEQRRAPFHDTSANLRLVSRDDRLPQQGIPESPPRPAICAHYQDGTRVCIIRIAKATELAHPALRVLLHNAEALRRDIAVLNAGLHYAVEAEAYRADLKVFAQFVEEHRDILPTLIWKDTPPQHFQYKNGYYWWADRSKGILSGKKHERCRALTDEEMASEEVKAGGWFNAAATPIIEAAGLDILNTFPETVPLWNYHLHDQDCIHYCYPGAYKLWTYMLTQHLKKMTLRD